MSNNSLPEELFGAEIIEGFPAIKLPPITINGPPVRIRESNKDRLYKRLLDLSQLLIPSTNFVINHGVTKDLY